MKTKIQTTLSLSEENVKEIIADYLTKEGYAVSSNDVTISIGMRTVGYFVDEHDEPYFKEIAVKCK